jgi:hypothetical protein
LGRSIVALRRTNNKHLNSRQLRFFASQLTTHLFDKDADVELLPTFLSTAYNPYLPPELLRFAIIARYDAADAVKVRTLWSLIRPHQHHTPCAA